MINVGTMEVNIVTHCNNRCVACSHGAPWAERYFMPPEVLKHDLEILQHIIHCHNFFLLGGEPLLHPKLPELLDVVNATSIGDDTLILTNGTLVKSMDESCWSKLDWFQISVYPNLDKSLIEFAKEKGKQYGCAVGHQEFDMFCKQFKKDPEGKSFFNCPWKNSCYTIHNGFFFRCPESAMFAKRFMGLPEGTDGIAITPELTESELQSFLNNTTKPLRVCEICESYSTRIPWTQCESEEEWIRESTL